MSVSVVIISHHGIGNAMVNAVKITLNGDLPLPLSSVDILHDSDPEQLIAELKHLVKSLDQGDGVLILADIFGATPCNIATKLEDSGQTRLVSGLNLPMLLKVMNYPDMPLDELAQKALNGGRDGIILCQPPQTNE